MKSKDFLEQLQKINSMIENKMAEEEQLRSIATSTTVTMGERVQSSSNPHKMEDAILKFYEKQQEVNECIDRLFDKKQEVLNVIEQLPAIEYDLLHKMYVGVMVNTKTGRRIHYMDFSEIAERYDKSYSWATTVHGRALKKVQVILDNRKRV